jgi:hypothetical protein
MTVFIKFPSGVGLDEFVFFLRFCAFSGAV